MDLREKTIEMLRLMRALGLSRSARDQVLERLIIAMDAGSLPDELEHTVFLLKQSRTEEELVEVLGRQDDGHPS